MYCETILYFVISIIIGKSILIFGVNKCLITYSSQVIVNTVVIFMDSFLMHAKLPR